jgi:drug/metabolite transporter (DMT)-like permease
VREHRLFPAALLTTVAAIWGIAFVAMKSTLERIDVFSFLAWRFSIATIILLALRPKIFKLINFKFFKKGIVVGLFLGIGYIFQSIGLTKTTVGKTGFITGLYVVLTPLIAFFFLKKQIRVWDWLAAGLAAIGLGLLSFKGLGIGLGESLVFVSAIFFAMHILALSEWAADLDIYALATIQLGSCAVLTFLASLAGGFKVPPDSGVWQAILFTALLATAFAFIVQTWAQSFMPATTVAVILTLESVFAVAFGLLFLNEEFTFRIATGGILVMIAMYSIIYFDGKNIALKGSGRD